MGFQAKDLTGELFDPQYLRLGRAEYAWYQKGVANGLEDAENRRSIGRHGNQHVYVRHPQVSGGAFHIARKWTSGSDTFPIAELCRTLVSTLRRL